MGNTPDSKNALNASYSPKIKHTSVRSSFGPSMNHHQNTPYIKQQPAASIAVNSFHVSRKSYKPKSYSSVRSSFGGGSSAASRGSVSVINSGASKIKIGGSKIGGSLAGGASDSIVVNSFHVSCRSDKPKSYSSLIPGVNLAGIVLYSKNGKSQWTCNGIKCRAGYIILKKSKNVDHIVTNDGSAIHGKVYKSVFGSDPDLSIVRSGFARVNGTWKYNSWSCNAADNGYTDGKKQMNSIEKAAVKTAIQKWITNGTQNTYPSSTIYINPN